MPAIDTYSAGTVTLTNGSAVVTGAAVNWISGGKYNVFGGHWFRSGTFVSLILNVDSATQITLATPYTGTTAAGAAYQIFRYTRLETPEAVGLMQSLLDKGSAASPFSRVDLDSGALRASFRDDGAGNLGWYIANTGVADGSQTKFATIAKADGAWTLGRPMRFLTTDIVFGSASSFSPTASNLQQVGTAGGGSIFSQARSSADNFGPLLVHGKTRSGTIATHALVLNGDNLGRYWAYGSDGANFIQAAAIEVYADGVPATNDMPGRIVLATTPAGATTPIERLRISSNGTLSVPGNFGLGSGGASTTAFRLHLQGENAGSGPVGSPTVGESKAAVLAVISNGNLAGAGGAIEFGGQTGKTFAAIRGALGSGSDNTAGHLDVYTRLVGSDAAMQHRLRFENSGAVRPGADNTQNLGAASFRWKELFCGNNVINTSDGRLKTEVRALAEAESAAARDLAGEIGVYQWLDAVAEKGPDEARLHIGMTVQRAIEIMEDHGLDPVRYGFICRDEITRLVTVTQTEIFQATDVVDEEHSEIEIRDGVPVLVKAAVQVLRPRFAMVPVVDEAGHPVMRWVPDPDGNEERDGETGRMAQLSHPVPVMTAREVEVQVEEPAGDRLGFRYDQLTLFIMRGLVERMAEIEH